MISQDGLDLFSGKGGDMMEMMSKPSKEKEGLCLSQDEVLPDFLNSNLFHIAVVEW